MSILIGTILGRYEILGVIGRGSTGAVYKARDPKIDRLVAIKAISLSGLEAGDQQHFRERLFQEARAAGRLSHPAIVNVFDVGEDPDNGDPYIVMEYVQGHQMDRLPGSDARLQVMLGLRLLEEVAEALDYAHRQGVIHRDIKPANILVNEANHPKVADFGIAKLNQSTLTTPGDWLGTPAYMAPEQLSGEKIDGRADLFSLGVILYTVLTGHRPFQGNSMATVMMRLVHHNPLPVSAFEPDLPQPFDEVALRAISKEPDARYQSGAEMAAAIRSLRECVPGNLPSRPSGNSASYAYDYNHPAEQSNFVRRQLERIHVDVVTKSAERGRPAARKQLTKTAVLVSSIATLIALVGYRYGVSSHHGPVPDYQSVRPTETAVTVPDTPPKPSADAVLRVEIEHHFSAGQAFVWLDGTLAFSEALKGESKKRAFLFRQTKGSTFKSLRLREGKHEIKICIKSAKPNFNETSSLDAYFSPDKVQTLLVKAEKPLRLTLQ